MTMPYPVCGQCGSRNVFADRDEIGGRVFSVKRAATDTPALERGFT